MTQRRAHRTLQRACLVAALAAGNGVTAATPPLPPEDLLEYLGSWAGDEADWLVANAAVQSAVAANAPSAAPVAARQPATTTTTTTAAPRAAPAAPTTGAERKP